MASVVIVPGNGAGCASANFYPRLQAALQAAGHACALEEMPDPDVAREAIWLPFITNTLGAGAGTVLVGHSSGAVAGLRLAESAPLAALVLVSVTPSDLGNANERASGYYSRPWQWQRVRANVRRVVMFASRDDPFIPLALQREAAEGLRSVPAEALPPGHTFEYVELDGRSHFFSARQPEITEACLRLCAEQVAGGSGGGGGGGGGGAAAAGDGKAEAAAEASGGAAPAQ